jgi:hypothetical protein
LPPTPRRPSRIPQPVPAANVSALKGGDDDAQ